MAEWRVGIEGSTTDILPLLDSLIDSDLNVVQENEQYFLRGDDFEVYTEAHDVLVYAESLLPLINGVAKVHFGDADPVKLGNVSRIYPDGHRDVFAFMSATAGGRARVFAALTVTTRNGEVVAPVPGTTIGSRLEVARRCPEVSLALRFFASSPNWFDLYKVSELIEQDVGNVRGIVGKGWCNKADFDHFTASANNYHATGSSARHARLDWRPMNRPAMTLQEAEDFIRGLLDNWIRLKAV
jgi:hypothetical protein